MELQNMSAKQLDALEKSAIDAGVQDRSYMTAHQMRGPSFAR